MMRFNVSGNGKEATLTKQVKHLINQGKDQKAIELVSNKMALDPDEWYFPFLLGWIHRTQNNLEEALGFYQQAERIAPNELYVQLALGDMLLLSEHSEEALPYYESCLKAWPDSSEIHSFYGIALFRLDRLKEAQHVLEKSCQLSPFNPDARYELVELYHQTSQRDKIIPLLKQYLNSAPDLASAYSLMGDYLFWEEGNCEGACQYYDQALSLYLQSENQDWFRQYLNTADFPRSLIESYLYSLMQCGYYDICRDVIKDNLEPPESIFWQIELYRIAGDLHAALELAAEGSAAYPDLSNMRAKYAEQLLVVGRPNDAQIEIQKAIELLPKSFPVDPWYDALLFVNLLRSGKEDKANQRLEKINPNDLEMTLVHIIHTLMMIEEWASVIQYSNMVISADPENIPALHSLARAYAEVDKYPEAIKYYKKLLNIQPRNGIAQLELGFIYEKEGQVDEAKLIVTQVLESNILSLSYRKLAQEKLQAWQ